MTSVISIEMHYILNGHFRRRIYNPSKVKTRYKFMKNSKMLSDSKIVTYEVWEIKMKDKLKWDYEVYRIEKEKVSFVFFYIVIT